jgi:hypothetical protein
MTPESALKMDQSKRSCLPQKPEAERGTLPNSHQGVPFVSLHRAPIPVLCRSLKVWMWSKGVRVWLQLASKKFLSGTLILIAANGVPIPEDAAMHSKAGSGRVMSNVL